MIRFNEPVEILEWGIGTNTTNQKWTKIAEGTFSNRSVKDGITTLIIQTKGINRSNKDSTSVKLCQKGEGMTACSDRWGEVANGDIKSVSGNTLEVQIAHATKISGAANPLQKFLGLP